MIAILVEGGFGDLLGFAKAFAARGDDGFAFHCHVEDITARGAVIIAHGRERQRADLDGRLGGDVHGDMRELEENLGTGGCHQRARKHRLDDFGIGFVNRAHGAHRVVETGRLRGRHRPLNIA